MVDITEVSAAVAAAGVLIGVVYYVLDMRNQSRMRQTDLVMRLYATYSSNEFQDSWREVVRMARRTDGFQKVRDVYKIDDMYEFNEKHGFREFNQVCLFFEGVGILLQRRLLDTRMIEDLFGGNVLAAWEYLKIGVIAARKQLNDQSIYYYFEYLYNEMKKREQHK